MTLSSQQEIRLKQKVSTVRKISCYWQRLKINEEREMVAKNVMRKIFVEQLSDLVYFNYMFGQISSKVLDRKLPVK